MNRNASDQLTALLSAAAVFGAAILLGVPLHLGLLVALVVEVGLVASFVHYRHTLRDLQPQAFLINDLELADEQASGVRRVA